MDETDRPKGDLPGRPRSEETAPPAEPRPSPEAGKSPAPAAEASPREEPVEKPAALAVPQAAAGAPAEAPPVAARARPAGRPSLAERLAEPEEIPIELPERTIRSRTRRDFLLLGAGAIAGAGAFWWLLPDETKGKHLTPALRDWLDSLEGRIGADRERRERFLNRALTFDDDVAEALYSPTRSVRTYSKSSVTSLRNNYNGATPNPDYLPGWTLAVSGLASGRAERFTINDLLERFPRREQVTRLCCVEGWSAIAWWGGLRFADLLEAHPPMSGARWARIVSAVSVNSMGESDPYYVSIDLPTARHPQTLLATHFSGGPLPIEHGAPLRLVAPMKLGLKNIKAITSIEYSAEEPADYWNERGYSKYDGL
jgi:DMSO/TMAO reductase YedYZ molybdopterin-dependent catalytic subunit